MRTFRWILVILQICVHIIRMHCNLLPDMNESQYICRQILFCCSLWFWILNFFIIRNLAQRRNWKETILLWKYYVGQMNIVQDIMHRHLSYQKRFASSILKLVSYTSEKLSINNILYSSVSFWTIFRVTAAFWCCTKMGKPSSSN